MIIIDLFETQPHYPRREYVRLAGEDCWHGVKDGKLVCTNRLLPSYLNAVHYISRPTPLCFNCAREMLSQKV